MELVQDKQERMVTFSKRREGLFKKAQELSKLSGYEIAIITFSGARKAFTFRCSDFDDIISSYLSITSTSPIKGLQVESQPPNHLEHHVMEVSNQKFEQENLFFSQTHHMVSSSSSITTAELLPPIQEHPSKHDMTGVCVRPWNGCDQFYPQFDEQKGEEWNGCGFDIGPDSAPTFFQSVQEDEQYQSGSSFFQPAEEGYGCGLLSFHNLTPNQVDEGAILPFYDDEGYGFESSFSFSPTQEGYGSRTCFF